MTPPQRAILAAEIIDGRIVLVGLTTKSIAAIAGVSQPYVNAALRTTPEQRAAIARGDRPLVTQSRTHKAAAIDWSTIDDDTSSRLSVTSAWTARCRPRSRSSVASISSPSEGAGTNAGAFFAMINITAPSTAKPAAKDRPVYVLELRPEPGVDPVLALRALLKLTLRRFGMRCISARENIEEQP
jgi:hypothetical protein